MKLSEQKHQQILQAAVKSIGAQGLEATSMDYIASQAQVSKRTVYNHFSSKEQLFDAVLGHMAAQLSEVVNNTYNPSVPVRQQLKVIAQNEVEILVSEDFLRLSRAVMMQLLKDSAYTKKIQQFSASYEDQLSDFISAAVQHGVLKVEDSGFAAKQFVYHLKSFVYYPLLYGMENPDTSHQNYIIEKTLDMFLAQYACANTP